MIFLERPKIKDTPDIIFETCVNSYSQNSGKAEKLLRCKPLVKQDADAYEQRIRSGSRDFPKAELPGDVKSDELYGVYDEKFAKNGTVGRKKYYNKIKQIVKGKGCPVCGEKGKITLDHYLPKNEYPTLCVTPDNLIPICMDCNTSKGMKSESRGHGVPVHLYFDRLPKDKEQKAVQAYLFVRLGANFEAEYYVECPAGWNADLRGKVANQMEIYNLRNRFSEFAVIEMGNLQTRWSQGIEDQRRLLEEELGLDASAIDPKKLFSMMIRSDLLKEQGIDPNSWKTALYRALYQKADELAQWLERKQAAQQKETV